jgi:hypothetical protein
MRRLLTASALACAVLAGCGGDDEDGPEEQVRKATRDYLTALASGNHERACSTLSAEAQEQAVEEVNAAYPDPVELSCGDAIQELSADIAPESKRTLLNPKVRAVTIRGDRATAEVEKVEPAVPLRQVEETWRVERSTFDVGR